MGRSGVCLGTKIVGETNRLAGLISCILSSFSILWESKSRRIELCLYSAPKFIEGIWNFLVRRGLMKDIPF